MDEETRQRYLHAIGIERWRVRDASAVPGSPPSPVFGSASLESAESTQTGSSVARLTWEELAALVAGCRACGLCETRTQSVFGVGNRTAELMVIGEAPGAEEDRKGEPFVGRAGRLLDAMLHAIGLQRSQVFIANVLKCRPPGNRDPRPDETEACWPFLERQVELIAPRVILSVGRISAQSLLDSSQPVGRLRARVHQFGKRQIPLVVSYHPAYLLRSPEEKAKAWKDLQTVASLLRNSG